MTKLKISGARGCTGVRTLFCIRPFDAVFRGCRENAEVKLVQAHQTERQPWSQANHVVRGMIQNSKRSHSPSEHAASEYKEDTDNQMEPKISGARLWRIT